jgi:hypothetical protein
MSYLLHKQRLREASETRVDFVRKGFALGRDAWATIHSRSHHGTDADSCHCDGGQQ